MLSKKNLIANIVQNLVFWTISFVITMRLFMQTSEVRTIDIIYTFLFHIPFITIVSINIYHLVPNILNKYGFWLYVSMTLIAGFGVTHGLYWLSYGPLASFLFPDYYFVAIYGPLEILGIMTVYVLFSTLIELSKTWFNRKETELKFSQLEEENTKSELKALRAQINPHFLFNNLNTIYGEALKKSDKAPAMILKLSSILRYIVENMEKEAVPLEEEIDYIEKFVELQRDRLSNPMRVLFKTEGDFSNHSISPLLLITFIENCFKHGTVTGVKDRINIQLSLASNTLTLRTENPKNAIEILEETSSGTGIENATRRLNFMYPEKHSLDISETDTHYKLELTVELSK